MGNYKGTIQEANVRAAEEAEARRREAEARQREAEARRRAEAEIERLKARLAQHETQYGSAASAGDDAVTPDNPSAPVASPALFPAPSSSAADYANIGRDSSSLFAPTSVTGKRQRRGLHGQGANEAQTPAASTSTANTASDIVYEQLPPDSPRL